MNTLQKPSDRDYKSIRTWFWNKKPVYEEEAMFIKRREDLLSLRHGREWSSFDGLVENCLRKMHCPLLQVDLNTLASYSMLTFDTEDLRHQGTPPEEW
jgi:hypothetical protein